MFANVIVEGKSKFTDTFYQYDIGDLKLSIGDRVIVPFGKKILEGYIFSFTNDCNIDEKKIKNIISKSTYLNLNEEIIKTVIWMKQRYGIKYFDAIKLFIPKGKPPKEGKEKEPYKNLKSDYIKPNELTSEQVEAVKTINKKIENNENASFLIHGVTSSGKTEVYLDAIEKAVSLGKSAIMLVPEISLTNQTIERFIGRFGKDKIAVLHSKLTERERYDEWTRIRNNKAQIVIGARMGVFAPVNNLGIIIIDEEHEATYKSDMSPKYDAKEVAMKRAMNSNGILVLGSATPSVVSYEYMKEGIYQLIELKERYNKTPLPTIDIVDMRKELKNGNTSLLSHKLFKEIKDNLENNKQVILLQNRRGYSNYVLCKECGNVIKCPDCNITLTYHKSNEKLVCHYCGRRFAIPKNCPKCNSKYIKYMGIGTEQVEEYLSNSFPDKVIKRLDLDISINRKNMDDILKDFRNKKIDILVGTQLIAKGLDFENVGLVGVVDADTTLNIPDYRSYERTFELLTQVGGRAGRGCEQGHVIIQTSNPDIYIMDVVKEHSYTDFFNEEIKTRKYLEYPPFGDLIVCYFTSNKEELSYDVANRAKAYLIKAMGDDGSIFTPKVSYNTKGEETYRTYILIKSKKGKRNEYVYYLDEFSNIIFNEGIKCNMNIDVNPYSYI